MDMIRWAALVLTAPLLAAQAPEPLASEAANWAIGLTDRFQRYTNRVVSAHALGGLAAAVCPHNKPAGEQIFRLAIARIDGIPVRDFDDEDAPVLPAASFTRLWRSTEAHAKECNPALIEGLNTQPFEEKIFEERGHAALRVRKAFDTMDNEMTNQAGKPERAEKAAQLVEGALDVVKEADDPSLVDFTGIGQTLSMVRDRYPEGADRVFRYEIEVVVTARAPGTALFNELGKYLFVAPLYREWPDWQYRSTGTASFTDFRATRYSTNPELIEAYIDALFAITDAAGVNYDPATAYAIAYQLLPKARDLELNSVERLERLLAALPAAGAAQFVASVGGSAADSEAGEPGLRRDRTIRLTLRAASRGRIDEARNSASGIDDARISAQVAVLIAFAEAREAISKKDWQRAPVLANLLPSGVKRALLYAGIMASAPRDIVLQEAGLQVRDAQALPAEFRIALFCAASQAMLDTEPEQALLLLTQAVVSANDRYTRPLEARSDAAQRRGLLSRGAAANTDVPLIALGDSTLREMVDGRVGRHLFQLSIPGVGAYNLPAAFAVARKLDFRRLEAVALNLREERVQAQALLAIAASLLQR